MTFARTPSGAALPAAEPCPELRRARVREMAEIVLARRLDGCPTRPETLLAQGFTAREVAAYLDDACAEASRLARGESAP